jgi:uncharacterized protein HemY
MGTLEYLKYRDNLLKRLLNTTDEKILKKIEDVFNNNEQEDFWNELSDVEKNGIELGFKQIEKGETFSYEEIISEHR